MKSYKTLPNNLYKAHLPKRYSFIKNLFPAILDNEELMNDSFAFTQITKSDKFSNLPFFDSDDFNNLLLGFWDKNTSGRLFGFPPLSSNKRDAFNSLNALKAPISSDTKSSRIKINQQSLVVEGSIASSNNHQNIDNNNDVIISRNIVEVYKNTQTQLDEIKVKDNLTVVFAENLQIDSNSRLDLLDIYGIVDKALRDSYDYLSKFRFDPEYSEKLKTAFGNDFNREVADKLFDNFAEGNFTDIPTIKIVNRAAIHGGNGAFSEDTGLVYLTVEFLNENYNNIPNLTDVLLEETGHFVDFQINEIDAPGDEGDIFSELVQGNTLTEEKLQALKIENDIITVIRNGQEVTTIRNNGAITIENNDTNILRVATWNIYGNNGNGSNPYSFEDRLKAISQLGNSNDIDVIVLQEVLTSNLDNEIKLNKLINIINQATANKYDIKYVANEYSQTDRRQWYSDAITGYLVLYNKSTIQAGNIDFYKKGDNAWKSGYQVSYQSGVDGNGQLITITGDVYYRPPIKLDITKNGQTYNLFTWHNETNEKKTKTEWTVPQGTVTTNPAIAALTSFSNLVISDTSINQSKMVVLGDLNVSSRQLAQQNLFTNTNNTLDGFNLNKKKQANDFIFAGVANNIQPCNIPYTLKSDAHYPVFADIFPDIPNIDNTSSKKRNADEFNTGQTQIKRAKRLNQGSTTMTATSSSLADSTNTQIISWAKELIYLGDNNDNIFDPLIIVDGGIVEVVKDANGKEWIYVKKDISGNNPKIYAAQGDNGDSPLFEGEMTFDPDNLAASLPNNKPGFKLLGVEVIFDGLAFNEDRLKLKGHLTLPEALGSLQLAVNEGNYTKGEGNHYISMGADGLDVTGAKLQIPSGTTTEFNIFGLKIKVENPSLSFQKETVNEEETLVATLGGTFTVPNLNNATLDLSNGKYIKVKKTNNPNNTLPFDLAINAGITVNQIDIWGDWKLKNFNANLTQSFGATTITGSLAAKLYTSQDTSQNEIITITGEYNKKETDKNGIFTSAAKSGVGTDFSAFGTDIDIRTIKFVSDRNPTDDNYWDPKSTLTDGYITLPELFGKNDDGQRIQVALKDLDITKDGFSLGGATVSLPDFTVNLLGLPKLKATATGIKLEYAKDPNKIVINASGQNVAEEYFKIQGTLQLSPEFYKLTANFSGSNYIKISNNSANPVEVVGTFSAENVELAEGWIIKYAELGINTTNKRVTAKGTLIIPSKVEIGADVIFDNGVLTYADIKADHLNKPIGTTGAYLQSIEGKYNKEENTSQFIGKVGITAGAEININLPSWAGGGIHGSLVELDATATITSSYFKTTGNITVLGGLIKGNGDAEINWANKGKEYLWATSNFNILNGLITTQTQFLATSKLDLYMFGEASVKVPDFIPFIGGTNLGSAEVYVEYTNDGISSNDYVAAWGTAFSNTLWEYTIGIQVSFDGNWHIINSQEAKTIGGYATTKIKNLYDSLNASPAQEPQHQIGDQIKDITVISGTNINGTDGSDTLHGDNNPNTINGKKGDDLLLGEGGNDTLYGNENEDLLHGGYGDDFLYGGTEDDYLYGEDNNDKLYGESGNDHLDGEDGDDLLEGGANDDYLNGGAGNDTLKGGGGNDYLYAGDNNTSDEVSLSKHVLEGGDGNDTLHGAKEVYDYASPHNKDYRDILPLKYQGTETFVYNKIDETLNGGIGIDAAAYNQNNTGVKANLKDGTASYYLERYDIFLNSITYNTVYYKASQTLISIENLIGSSYGDVLIGDDNSNIIEGGEGKDTLTGGANTDTFVFNGISEGIDTITDFNPLEGDKIQIDISQFGSISMDQFSYDRNTGALSYKIFDFASPIYNYNGHQYLFSNVGTWEQIQALAQTVGGNLVTINDQNEQDWLVNTFGGGEDFWIGLTDKVTEGAYKWVTGETYNFNQNDWYQGEPNNAGNEDYVGMNYGSAGKWNDSGSGSSLRGIIEINSGNNSITNFPFFKSQHLITLSNKPDFKNSDLIISGDHAEIFESVSYLGKSLKLIPGRYDYDKLLRNGFDRDILSSLKVPQGWTVALYKENNFKELSRIFTGSSSDVNNANDSTDSLIVFNNYKEGTAGNDTLKGEYDYYSLLKGGASNDVYIVLDSITDTIIENPAEGTDTVQSSVTFSIADIANVENLSLIGTAAINGTGNAANNIITGNSGNNILNGGAGDDTLNLGYSQYSTDTVDGGVGDDLLQVDYSSKNNGAGIHLGYNNTDRIYHRAGTVGDNFELVQFSNIERFDITGTKYADAFEGRTGNDIFSGGAGSDELNGGGGNDTLDGGADNDILNGGAGSDILNGGAGSDILNGGDGNDILDPGFSSGSTDTVDGGAGNDVIRVNYTNKNDGTGIHVRYLGSNNIFSRANGNQPIVTISNVENYDITGTQYADAFEANSGNDIYSGGNGDDILNGGTGNDTLTGGGGKDTLTGGTGFDSFDYRNLADSLLNTFDVITDFNATASNDDLFLVSTARSGFSNAGSVATLNATDIAAKLTTANFGSNSAAQFTFGSRTFVAINDATAGFNANSDAIIKLQNLQVVTLTASNFIVDGGGIFGINSVPGGGINISSGGFTRGDTTSVPVTDNPSIQPNEITGTPGRDTLIGTSTSDRITGLQGADTITGGDGNDEFVYTNIRDNGDTITDFEVGKDHIVFTQLLDSLVTGGYNGANAIADGYVKLVQGSSTSNFSVQIDADGSTGDDIFRPFITVNLAGTGTLNNPSSFVF